jgi:hypothetical protein
VAPTKSNGGSNRVTTLRFCVREPISWQSAWTRLRARYRTALGAAMNVMVLDLLGQDSKVRSSGDRQVGWFTDAAKLAAARATANGRWVEWVLVRPDSVEACNDLRALHADARAARQETAFIIFLDSCEQELAACVLVELALANTNTNVEFLNMKLIESPPRLIVASGRGEEESIVRTLCDREGHSRLLYSTWVTSHLDFLGWDPGEFEQRWWTVPDTFPGANRSLSWLPSVYTYNSVVGHDQPTTLWPLSRIVRWMRNGQPDPDMTTCSTQGQFPLTPIARIEVLATLLFGWILTVLCSDVPIANATNETIRGIRDLAVAKDGLKTPVSFDTVLDLAEEQAYADLFGARCGSWPLLAELLDAPLLRVNELRSRVQAEPDFEHRALERIRVAHSRCRRSSTRSQHRTEVITTALDAARYTLHNIGRDDLL